MDAQKLIEPPRMPQGDVGEGFSGWLPANGFNLSEIQALRI
jgi:hypothetical protein